ncbi:MAG: galactokinase, partial [Chitinophagales bacterium]
MNPVLQKIKSYWQNCYKTAPDIIVKSSGRINLIGEHTDYNDGFVLPASIDKGIYVGIGKSTENTQMIALDKNEELVFSSHSNCKALFPKGAWQNYTIGVIEEIKKTGREIGDFKAVFSGDIPQGAGLSSSAALENAFVFALNKLFDLELTPWQMIKISQQAEHNYAGVQCGIMDQFASMMGEKGEVILLDCRSLDFFTKKIDLGKYQLLLINSGMSHQLANSEYNKRRAECESAVAKIKVKYKEVKALRDVSFDILNSIKLNKTEYKRTKYILEENGRVLQSVNALGKGDVATFGKILFEA